MTLIIKLSLLMALIPFAFSLLIDVCLGHPAAEGKEGKVGFDNKAIFFSYSLWLAKLRLNKYKQWRTIYNEYKDRLNSPDLYIKDLAKSMYRNIVFETAQPMFTWEKGLGMCPVCTNIRFAILFAVIVIIYFKISWLYLLLIPCFSNLYLLIYNKLKN